MIEEYSYDGFGAPTVYNGVGNLGQNGTIYNNRFLFTGREENRNRGQSINLDRLGRGRVGHGTMCGHGGGSASFRAASG
jgi:hypothetical protein